MKRWIIGLVVLGCAVVLVIAAIFFGLGFWLSPQNALAKSDAIVAISGGETEARTAEAISLYKNGWAPHVIFSGAAADPNSPSNARAMADIAEGAGVPAAAISLEEAAINTSQNATGVAAIVNREHYGSIILVTSPYHQRRALVLFQRALGGGVRIINHSSYDQAWRRSHWWATPYSFNLTLSELQKTLYVLWIENKG